MANSESRASRWSKPENQMSVQEKYDELTADIEERQANNTPTGTESLLRMLELQADLIDQGAVP